MIILYSEEFCPQFVYARIYMFVKIEEIHLSLCVCDLINVVLAKVKPD
jgi:hypothetical protein